MSKITFEEEDGSATVLDSFSISSGGRQLMQEADEEEVWDGWEVRNIGQRRSNLSNLLKSRFCIIMIGAVGVLVVIALLIAAVFVAMGGTKSNSCSDQNANDAAMRVTLQELAKPVVDAIDKSVDPCTDFYQYACGGWLKSVTLPPDKTSISRSFTKISDENLVLLREILEDGWPVISDFYSNCMDNQTREARGSAPLKPWLSIIDNATSSYPAPSPPFHASLLRALALLHKAEISSLFSFDVGTDLDDPSFGLPNLDQSGIGLPRDYYFNPGAVFDDFRNSYKKHIESSFKLAGTVPDTELESAVDAVYSLEEKLANVSQTPSERRDPYAVFHKVPLSEVTTTYSNVPWTEYFTTLGVEQSVISTINVANKRFFATVNQLILSTPVRTWKLYLQWSLLRSTASLLSPTFVEERYEFNKALTGVAQKPADWKICVSTTSTYLGWIVDRVYVLKRFPADSKPQAKQLIENLELAFKNNMNKLDWMDPVTLHKALTKLDSITNKVGYPDQWPTYEDLFVRKGLFFEAAMQVRMIEKNKELAKMGKPTDRGEWEMFSHDVNAYYRPDLNEIVFPAGILQPPFFRRDFLNSMNYGGAGMVIGHELSHGFDDEGRQFDDKGRLVNWWSDSTLQKFTKKADCIKDQYSNFTVLGGTLHLNGGLTLGENIADNGGLKQAYTAFKQAGEKLQDVSVVPELFGGITNDQLFFVSFAQTWCAKYTDKALTQLVLTNPHSPSEFRVTGPLRNSPEFAAAFNCPAGSPMNPTDKCLLW